MTARPPTIPFADAELLGQILEHSDLWVAVKDRERRFVRVSRRLRELFGAAEPLGRTVLELLPAADAEAIDAHDRAVLASGQAAEFEEQLGAAQRRRTFLSTRLPLFGADGAVCGLCAISTEISGRKRIEDALREVALGVSGCGGADVYHRLARHLALTLAVDFAFIAVVQENDPSAARMLAALHRGTFLDETVYRLEGTPCRDIIGCRFGYIADGLPERFPGDLPMMALGLRGYAGYPLFDSAGEPLGLIAVAHGGTMPDPAVTEAILRICATRAAGEIERERAEAALRASEERYRAIFEASVDGLAFWSPEGQLVDLNPAFTRMHGYSRDELLRMDPHLLVHPDAWAELEGFLDILRSGAPFHAEARDLRKDGSVFPVEVHGVRIEFRGAQHLLAVVRDLTERRAAEQERSRLEAQLRQAQKMEALGHLSGGIAHDFNNILTSILGYAVLAAERDASRADPKLARYLEQIRLSGEHARDLIAQMLAFSRGQRGEPRALRLPALVHEAAKLYRSSFPATVAFEAALDADAPPVMIDPILAEQVLMNLCINARDAMQGSGTIRVGVRLVQADAVCASCRQAVRGEFVELSVADSGPGIPAEVQERMFEPFFTTKDVGKGSGMGLATSHGIVHEYGGHLLVDTAPGAGAVFRVLLPPTAAGAGTEAGAAPAPATARRRARVLVVDDEASVRAFMRDLLESRGFGVRVADDGEQALALLEAADPGFELVITDQTMPRLSGIALAQAIRARWPTLAVILYTGYRDRLDPQALARAGVNDVLRKPLGVDELFAAIERALKQPAPGP